MGEEVAYIYIHSERLHKSRVLKCELKDKDLFRLVDLLLDKKWQMTKAYEEDFKKSKVSVHITYESLGDAMKQIEST